MKIMEKLLIIFSVTVTLAIISYYAFKPKTLISVEQTTYIVTETKSNKDILMCEYYVETSYKDGNFSDGWFTDSIGQYKVGDKLIFQLQNNCGRYKIIK